MYFCLSVGSLVDFCRFDKARERPVAPLSLCANAQVAKQRWIVRMATLVSRGRGDISYSPWISAILREWITVIHSATQSADPLSPRAAPAANTRAAPRIKVAERSG